MTALNPNNPNGGGKGDSAIAQNVPKQVIVETPSIDPGHGAVPKPNPQHGSKPEYLS